MDRCRSGQIESESGATLVEYSLIITFVIMVVFGAAVFVGGQTERNFHQQDMGVAFSN